MKTLKDIREMDENKIRDDDHLDRPDITKEEFQNAIDELIEEHGLKEVSDKKPSLFALATIEALNKLK